MTFPSSSFFFRKMRIAWYDQIFFCFFPLMEKTRPYANPPLILSKGLI